MTLAAEQGFPYFLADGTFLQGSALAEQGQGAEGIPQMRQGLAVFRSMGTNPGWAYWLALLAEAYGKVGQAEEGLPILAEALAFVSESEEHLYEAELYRLKGELTLQQERQKAKGKNQKAKGPKPKSQSLNPDSHAEPEAEAYFLKAIEVARQQQAKSLELRATISLVRLWQQQGKQHEARNMLSGIYNWFTEGLDTKDLQEAKALIEELRH
jgi:predicted ATPase